MSEKAIGNRKQRVLYVDDEKHNLDSFRAVFRREYNVFTALSADEGMEIIRQEPEFPIILSDQRMPDKTGVEFFEEVEKKHPNSLRVLITGYTDIEATIGAINQGKIFYYITKPWDNSKLSVILKKGFERYCLEKENKELSEEKKFLLLKAEKEEKEKIRAQLEILKNQVNPHFLFNSLNTLYALIKDNTEGRSYVRKLSNVFRHILEHSEKNIVPLSDEIRFIVDYLYLQKIRFKDGFVFNTDIPKHYFNYMLPSNSLQLLVENIFKHNMISKESPLIVDIFVDSEDNLVIRNNYQPRKDVISTGIGHKNLEDRYKLLKARTPLFLLTEKYYIASVPLFEPQP